MTQNLRHLLSLAFVAGAEAGLAHTSQQKARILDDLVRRGSGLPVAWQPEFDAASPEQEELAFGFCAEILETRKLDPATLLDMAEHLYRAERNYALSLIDSKDTA